MFKLEFSEGQIPLRNGWSCDAGYFGDTHTIKIDSTLPWWWKVFDLVHEIFHYLNHIVLDLEFLDLVWDVLCLVVTFQWHEFQATCSYSAEVLKKRLYK